MPPRAAAQLAERAGLSVCASASTPASDPPADSTETQRLLRLLLTIYTYVTLLLTSLSSFTAFFLQVYALTGCGNSRCEPLGNTRAFIRRTRRHHDTPFTLATPRTLAVPRMFVA